MLWTNLFRGDINSESPLGAGVDPCQIEALQSAQRSLLRDEIAILKPHAVVFFTGPDYDEELKAEFPQVEFLAMVEGVPTVQLALLKHQLLPPKTFRTYHPIYLNRSGKGNWIEIIADRIMEG